MNKGRSEAMILGQLFLQRVGYAVHVLCYLTRTASQDGLTTASQLADWMQQVWPGTSKAYLSNVIHRLVRGGILHSQRGIFGGYSLARRPEQITLHDVVALLEGFSFERCALTPEGHCPVQEQCDNYEKLGDLHKKYADLLAEISIADLAHGVAAPITKQDIPKSVPA